MKELSIEEKAKAYDEAKARMSIAYNSNRCTIGFMNEIFPELKESEDERMLNQLHSWMKEFGGAEEYTEKVYRWIKGLLEKQGDIIENNMLLPFKEYDNLMDSINKKKKEGYEAGYKQGLIDSKNDQHVQPKFKVGDTIRIKNSSAEYVITDIYGGCYHGKGWGIDIISADRSGDYELVEKQDEQKPAAWSEEDLICLGYLADFVDKNGNDFYGKNKPNVVKWIRSFAGLPTHISINEIGQKPADKVEPKFKVGDKVRNKVTKETYFIDKISTEWYGTTDKDDFAFKIINQDEWELVEPSIADIVDEHFWEMLDDEKQGEQKPNYCHHEVDLSNCSEEYTKGYYDGWNNCNQQHAQLEAEQNPAWSEEDEVKINRIVACLENLNVADNDMLLEDVNFLKSLKYRYTWRPTEVQIEALDDFIYAKYPDTAKHGAAVKLLYQDLKKLRKE